MTDKVTLANLSSLENENTAINLINGNSVAIVAGFDNTLSRDGTSPNQMGASLDMNSFQILNLPSPGTINSPARLADVTLNPTITVPPTGTSGSTVPFLNGNNTWSGTNTWNSTSTFTGTTTIPSLTYTPPGTGGVARTVISKLDERVSVKDFGALGDGSTDDTNAFQLALNYLSSTGGCLYIPIGTYKVGSSALTYSGQKLRITGDGISSLLSKASTSLDLFQFSGLENIQLDHFAITSSQSDTSGTMINFTNTGNTSGNFWLDSLMTTGGYNTIIFNGGAQTFINSCLLEFMTNNAIHYTSTYAGNSFISGLQAYTIGNGAGINNGSGILVENGDGFFWQNILVESFSTGINIHPISGTFVKNVIMTNVNADNINRNGSGGSSFNIDGTTSGVVACERFYLTHCIGSSSPGWGFYVAGVAGFHASNCSALVNAQDGIRIGATTTNVTLTGCSFEGNSSVSNGGTINTCSGIQIDAGATNVNVIGCRAGLQSTTDVTNSQEYGINVSGSTCTGVVISGNNLSGNDTGPLNGTLSGHNNIVRDNLGYNPVGVTAAATAGTSPFTVTAGPTPETHYVNQSATNTATIAKGSQKIATLVGTTTYYTVELGPNESYVVTWTSTAPTYTKDVH